MASYITKKCTSCGDCVSYCPTESIFLGAHHQIIDTDTCDHCHVCINVCPENAIMPDPNFDMATGQLIQPKAFGSQKDGEKATDPSKSKTPAKK